MLVELWVEFLFIFIFYLYFPVCQINLFAEFPITWEKADFIL